MKIREQNIGMLKRLSVVLLFAFGEGFELYIRLNFLKPLIALREA